MSRKFIVVQIERGGGIGLSRPLPFAEAIVRKVEDDQDVQFREVLLLEVVELDVETYEPENEEYLHVICPRCGARARHYPTLNYIHCFACGPFDYA